MKIGLLITLVACDRSASKPRLVAIDPPAVSGAASPNLIASGDSILLTWLEPTDQRTHRLRLSQLVRGVWTVPTTIAEGPLIVANWADVPSVARAADRTLVAHWAEKSGDEGYDVVLARSKDDGESWQRLGKPYADAAVAEHGFVSLVPDGDGILALWLDGRATGHEGTGATAIRAAHVGDTIGSETVIDDRVCDCCSTAAALTSDGPAIVYRDRSPDEIRDIAIARRGSNAWFAPTPVHGDGWQISGCPVNGPAIATSGRDVVVAWFTLAEQRPTVRVAFSGDAGATFDNPIEVDAPHDARSPLGRVDVVIDRPGEAIASWLAAERDDGSVLVRRIYRDGRVGAELAIASTSAARNSGFARMDALGSDLVLAWTDPRARKLRAIRVARAGIPAAR